MWQGSVTMVNNQVTCLKIKNLETADGVPTEGCLFTLEPIMKNAKRKLYVAPNHVSSSLATKYKPNDEGI